MSNIYFICDNCGIETNGFTFVNGMKFCAKCYHQIFGKDNQQTEIAQLKQQLAEKDKEIEMLKHTLNLYNLRHKGSVLPNVNQLAIQELEKAKDTIKHFCNIHNDEYYGVKSQVKGIEQDVCDQINQQIKELKGENFKCEICGEITPKNCEGGEPNVCAGCVPVETHDLRLHIEPQSHENNFLD